MFKIVILSIIIILAGCNYPLEKTHRVISSSWDAPLQALKVKNPIFSDSISTSAGREVYLINCFSCHGERGEGDGSLSIYTKPRPQDLTMKDNTSRYALTFSLLLSTSLFYL